MRKLSTLLAAAVSVTVMCAALPAMAKPDHAGGPPEKAQKHKEKHKHKGEHGKVKSKGKASGDSDRVLINIGDDRDRIRTALLPYYGRKCPPGLAKKNTACLPPGIAKKYAVGQPLPSWMDYWDVPADVLVLLPAAPHGARYVWVDRDILLISEATKKVLDAAVILSALD